ncbi:hypothetical protein HMPREF1544_08451 [Mucor circinelloides 1006PhL]|uniref:Uncharacterized protein n=1 Tax=Mucor circinelloides f. circinelloides (strain 1006PhL) TaxID=1220926 RepID=S2JQC1_MUCC1|nr:hypothetical protein HMPREF1544_08451 [Mucor circinelloides 1006PhL]
MAFAPVQHKKRRFGADFDIKFGFSTTVSTPAISSTSAQLKTRRIGANLALKFGFTTFKEYFKFKNNAANNYSTTDYSADLIDDTWNLVERDSALHFESS